MADIEDFILRFTGENDEAKDEINEILLKLAELEGVDIDIEAGIASGEFKRNAAEIMAIISALDNQDIKIDTEFHESKLEEMSRLTSLATKGWLHLSDRIESFGGEMGHLVVRLGPLHGALNLTNAAVIALAAGLAVALVGALGALVASIAAAVAAVAALGVAFVAALGPAIGLAIGVIARLTAVWKVLKQEQQAELQAQQDQIRGSQATVAAQRQREDAARNLQRAQQSLADATVAAYREMEDAAEDATDAILKLERAKLSEEQAALGIERAELELKKFRKEIGLTKNEFKGLFEQFTDVDFDPDKLNKELAKVTGPDLNEEEELHLKELILNVKDARLREKEATEGVSDAIREKSRAEERNLQFMQKGIDASPQYIAALRAVEDATRAVQRANDDEAIATGLAKTQAMTAELSDEERILLGVLRDTKKAFEDTFGPGVQGVIGGIAGGLQLIIKRIGKLKDSFTTFGDVVGGTFVALVDEFTAPEKMEQWIGFIEAATDLVAPLASIFSSLLTIFMNIATAAMPFLIDGFEKIAGWLGGIAASTGDIDRLSGIFATIVEHLTVWLSTLKTIGEILISFFSTAAPQGLDFAKWIQKSAEGMLDWMKSEEGREQIKEFLDVAIPLAKAFLGFIAELILVLARLGEVVGPILTVLLDLLGLALGLLAKGLRGPAKIIKALSSVPAAIVDILHTVKDDIGGWISDLAKIFTDLGGDIINWIVKGVKKLAGKLPEALKGAVEDAVGEVGDFLGLGSPSKKMAKIGNDMSKGLANGLKRAQGELEKAATSSLAVPALRPALAASAAAASGAVGGGGRGDVFIGHAEVQQAPVAGGGLSDPRDHAVQLVNELSRTGRHGRRPR